MRLSKRDHLREKINQFDGYACVVCSCGIMKRQIYLELSAVSLVPSVYAWKLYILNSKYRLSRTHIQLAHSHTLTHMLHKPSNEPRQTIMCGNVWVYFCSRELFPVEMYFTMCLNPAAALLSHVGQTVCTLCCTVNWVMDEAVELMTASKQVTTLKFYKIHYFLVFLAIKCQKIVKKLKGTRQLSCFVWPTVKRYSVYSHTRVKPQNIEKLEPENFSIVS